MTAIRALSQPIIIGVLVAVLAVAGSVLAGWIQKVKNDEIINGRFADLSAEFRDLTVSRFDLYQYGLRSVRGAVITAGRTAVTRRQFKDFIESRDPLAEFPGSRGIGYIQRVPADETDAFIASARADGFPDFTLRELSSNAGERFIIKYIYPLTGNEGATGLDIASETNRRQAALAAARTGHSRLTAPITLVQASGKTNHGFLILMPIYPAGMVSSDPEERQGQAIGWSYSPLVVSEILADLGPRREEIAFSLTDVAEEIEFFQSPNFNPALVTASETMSVFGRIWEIRAHMLPAFVERNISIQPLDLAAIFGTAGLLLAGAAYGLARNRQKSLDLRSEEEALARSIVEAAPQAVLVVDETGRIVRANANSQNVIGWPSAELIGQSVDELVPAAKRAGHGALRASYDRRSRAMGERQQLTAVRADGTEVPVLIQLAPLNIGGRRLVVAGIVDITAQQEAISILASSEQRWQELANSLPQLIWTCDLTGDCDFISRQWVDYTGIPAEQQLGTGWLNQIHPDDRAGQMEAWARAIASSSSLSVEVRIRRHDGRYRLFFARAEPIRNEEGEVLRWIGSSTDIEDRHQAELKIRGLLAEMEQRVAERTAELDTALHDLRNVLDAVPSLIAYWDRNQVNRFCNQAYENWFGMAPHQLVGKTMKEALGDELHEKNRPMIEAALAGEPQMFERELTDVTGRHRSMQAHYLPDVRQGKVVGIYALVFDVTELKASEASQMVAREAAEKATRAKSAFLTSMSHELRTPMNSILGFSDLLVSQHFGPLNEAQREYANIIKKSGEHLLRLMDSVLELSKIEAGQVSIALENVNVASAIGTAITTLRPLAEKYSVTIVESEPGDEGVCVSADPTRLTQILTNLGSNAIKYNKAGGSVAFSFDAVSDDIVRISVEDEGVGIPMERQKDVFEPFNRLGAEQGPVEGTGIGLSLIRSYVELMGGTIGFESEEGEGSTFWVELKPGVSESPDIEPSENGEGTAAPCSVRSGTKVVYVEDNEISRHLFRSYLATIDGIELLDAPEGRAGLTLIREAHPDIVFLDLNLPGLNGFDVLEALKADPNTRAIPVVALTASAMSGDMEAGLQMGFDRYLTKPVRLHEIQQMVTELQASVG